MGRLKAAMQDRYKSRDEDIKIHTPRNLETLELTFRSERVAKVCNRSLSRAASSPSNWHGRLLVLLLRTRHNPTTSSPVY